MNVDVVAEGVRAALEAVPLAAVVVDRECRPIWANRVALRMAAGPTDLASSRLFVELASSGPAREALMSGAASQGAVRLATDIGVVDRIVTAAALPSPPGAVVVTFAPPGIPIIPVDDELRQRLEALLEHTTEMITVLDRDGTIRFSNAAAGRISGFTGADVNGRFAFELIHPDDVDAVMVAFERALAQPGPSDRIEFRIGFADGRWHDVEASVNNLIGVDGIDGLVVSLRDITDRKAAEARREALLANLSDVIVVLNDQFEITYASDSISKVIDAPPETNLGMSAFNDVHPDDLPVARAALGRVAESAPGITTTVEVRVEHRPGSGEWRWVEATVVNRLTDPAVEGIVITLRDVTEQKTGSLRLQAAYERERENAARLAQLDRLKDDFLATVSHELRTPLAAIVGFAELISRDALDETTRQQFVDRIAASAADMRSMIDNVLDFSALEAGSVNLELAPVGLRDVVDSTLLTVAHQLSGHVIEDQVADELVIADPDGLGHVLRNLLTNAAKYSEAGTTITIRSRRRDGYAALEVVDRGVGIAHDERERIFERFYRSRSASFTARGSGIGLSIARRYADLMRGSLTVASTPGEGSTFTIILPSAIAC